MVENKQDPRGYIMGAFAYGKAKMLVNKDKVGWISKLHDNNRLTIKYPSGKSATWSKKNVVTLHPNEVGDDVKESDAYRKFINDLNESEGWFTPAQEDVLHEFKEILDKMKEGMNDTEMQVINLQNYVVETFTEANRVINELKANVALQNTYNHYMRQSHREYEQRISDIEETVRSMAVHVLPRNERGEFRSQFLRDNDAEATTPVSVSTGEAGDVSSMSEDIDLEHLHH